MKLYGSLENRLDENKMYCKQIEVGTGMTEYFWSDRRPYEVTEVKDQKHIKVRALDYKHVGDGSMDNNWVLYSNENNPEKAMTKRGNYWYWTVTVTSDVIDDMTFETHIWLANNDISVDTLREKGKVTRYHKANVSFGKSEFYYDYEF